MKTPNELNALKKEVEAISRKLAELSEDELTQVVGGGKFAVRPNDDGYYGISCDLSGKVLDVPGAVAVTTTSPQLYEANHTQAQKFSLSDTTGENPTLPQSDT